MSLATRRSPLVATIAAVGLLSQAVVPTVIAASQAAAKPAAPASQPAAPAGKAPAAAAKRAGAGTTATPPIDGGWPRLYDLPSGGTMLVYQPQVASWDKESHIVASSAVSQRANGTD